MAGIAQAHPPSDIQIAFDPQSKILSAVISHPVSNPANHYIEKVDVAVNGREILMHEISRQDDYQVQKISYLIPDLKSGDEIAVEAYCSISGKLEKEIKAQ